MSILKDLDPKYAKIQAAGSRKPHSGKVVNILFALTLLGGASMTWLLLGSANKTTQENQLASADTTLTVTERPASAIDSSSTQTLQNSALILDQPSNRARNDSGAPIVNASEEASREGAKYVSREKAVADHNAIRTASTTPPKRLSEKKASKKLRSRSQADRRDKKPEQRDIDIISAIVK